MLPKLRVYSLNWHLRYSPAVQYICVEPLMPYLELFPIGWDGDAELEPTEVLKDVSKPTIFFQLPPPPNILAIPGARLIWIPMWDQAKGYSQSWWDSLPKSLRIVAFSKAVLARARAADLPVLPMQFFRDPQDFNAASWDGRRVLLYWNRTGLLGPKFLERFCAALKIDVCLFFDKIDPLIPANAAYRLPSKLGKTEIQYINQTGFLPHQEYLQILEQANIFIAPRSQEGVGLTLIEAMARGCASFGFDAPTMNEYIRHKENGYLLPAFQPTITNRAIVPLQHLAWQLPPLRFFRHKHFEHPVTQYQDWQEIRLLDLPGMGKAAREGHLAGYSEWQKSIPDYARFILDW